MFLPLYRFTFTLPLMFRWRFRIRFRFLFPFPFLFRIPVSCFLFFQTPHHLLLFDLFAKSYKKEIFSVQANQLLEKTTSKSLK